jgi:hypothetical protein
MRLLICLVLLLSTGCYNTSNTEEKLKFIYGDKVIVIEGFFKNQSGVIRDYTTMYSTDCPLAYRIYTYSAGLITVCSRHIELEKK